MSRRAWTWLAGVVIVIALYFVFDRLDRQLLEDLGDGVEVQIPAARTWWTFAAQCLGDRAPYPERVRFYVGHQVPAAWSNDVVGPGRIILGVTDVRHQRIMLVPGGERDSSLVTHELWHAVHGGGHPDRIFNPPRCGLHAP